MLLKKGGNIDNLNKGIYEIKRTFYNIKEPDKLLLFLNDKLKPSEKAKNERGEVFTPLELVNEMLDKLPLEVWSNPNLKWLDPATGIGNFPVMVYLRLMNGLKYFESNSEKRRKHILENMLYMVEIDKLNVFLLKKVFCGNTYNLNIFEGSFIKETNNKNVDILFGNKPVNNKENLEFEKKVEKIREFDIILGNPPYNQGGIKSKTSKTTDSKTIWNFFIFNAFNLLKINGYFLFITPLSWLKSSHNCHNILLEKYLIYLELWDDNKSKQSINGEIPISIFLIKNIDNSIKKLNTNIKINKLRKKIIQNYNIYINKNNSIPLGFISQLLKLQNFIIKNNLFLDFKTTKLKVNDKEKFKLPNFKSIKLSDNYCIDTYTIKDGYLGNKTFEQHEDADKRKLIICNKATLSGIFIDDGKFGICGTHNYYILGDNLELLKNILDYKIIKIASLFTKFGQNFLDTDLFKYYIPDLRKIKGIQTEEQLYKAINLTKKEINEIEKFNL